MGHLVGHNADEFLFEFVVLDLVRLVVVVLHKRFIGVIVFLTLKHIQHSLLLLLELELISLYLHVLLIEVISLLTQGRQRLELQLRLH